MSGQIDDLSSPLRIQVILDGKPLAVPVHARASLAALRAYLEALALQQNRVVSMFTVDGVAVSAQEATIQFKSLQRVQADTISFAELSRQMIAAAHERVRQLQERVEAATMQVLINDWSVVEQLWQKWAPEFKSPILVVNFLRGLCGVRLDELCQDGLTLGQHVERFDSLWQELESIIVRQDALALSNALERNYGPWLTQLTAFLKRLAES